MGLGDIFDPYASPHARQQGFVALIAIVIVVVLIAVVAMVMMGSSGSSTPATPGVVVPATETPFATLNPDATPVSTADTDAPGRVTDLEAVTITESTIKWTWEDPDDDDLAGIKVYIDDKFMKDVSPGTEYYKATGLDEDEEYTISVAAYDESGNIGQYRDDSAETEVGDDEAPDAVSDLEASTIGDDYIIFTWEDPDDDDDDLDHILIQVLVNGVVEISSEEVDIGEEEYEVEDLDSGDTVKFRIWAVDENGNKSDTEYISVETGDDESGPAAVTNVDTSKGDDYITITWTDPDDSDLDDIRIYLNGDLEETKNEGVEECTLEDLSAGTTYTIIVVPVDDSGNEGSETQIIITTDE